MRKVSALLVVLLLIISIFLPVIKATAEAEWMVIPPSYTEKYDSDGDGYQDSHKVQIDADTYHYNEPFTVHAKGRMYDRYDDTPLTPWVQVDWEISAPGGVNQLEWSPEMHFNIPDGYEPKDVYPYVRIKTFIYLYDDEWNLEQNGDYEYGPWEIRHNLYPPGYGFQYPVSILTADPTDPTIDQDVTFDGSSSYDPDGGSIVSYYFDFGDGSNSGWIPQSSCTHSYPTIGYRNAKLKVRDDEGQETWSEDVLIHVINGEIVDIRFPDEDPNPTYSRGDLVELWVDVYNPTPVSLHYLVVVNIFNPSMVKVWDSDEEGANQDAWVDGLTTAYCFPFIYRIPDDAPTGTYHVLAGLRKYPWEPELDYRGLDWCPPEETFDVLSSSAITVNPNGGRIFVDEEPITTATDYSWNLGSTHTLDPDSGYSPDTGTRLLFQQWNDGNSDDPRSITVSGDATYTAQWDTQYYVTFQQSGCGDTPHVTVDGGSPHTLPYSTWMDSGSSHSFNFESPVTDGENQWVLTSTSHSSPIKVTGPTTVTGYYSLSGEIELYYDDGIADDGYAPTSGLYWYTVHFQTPTATLYKLSKVKYYVYSDPASFYVDIRDSSLQQLYYGLVTPTETGWFVFDLSSEEIFVEGDFYIGMKYSQLYEPELGADYTDPDGESGEGLYSFPTPNLSSLDWMIRAVLGENQKVQYTITTSPSGLTVKVDGSPYTAPKTFTWDVGSTYPIAVDSPQGSYYFDHWSDGGSQSHTITVGSSSKTITAYFQIVQRKLTVYSGHDSPVPSNGDHYYDHNDWVTCSVTSPVTEGSTVWTCTGWSGTGSVPSSGNGTSVSFTITQDSSITWNWQGDPTQVTAHSRWWLDEKEVLAAALVGDSITAKLEMSGQPSGRYRMRIMRDIEMAPDEEVISIEFDYDGGTHVQPLSFSPTIPTGEENTRGYHVDLYRKSWSGLWAEVWTLENEYPPRLRVYRYPAEVRERGYLDLYKSWANPDWDIVWAMLAYIEISIGKELVGDIFSVILQDPLLEFLAEEIIDVCVDADAWLKEQTNKAIVLGEDWKKFHGPYGFLGLESIRRNINTYVLRAQLDEIYISSGYDPYDFALNQGFNTFRALDYADWQDFVGTELGYMAFLAGEEKDAWKAGDTTLAEFYQSLQIEFIEHLEWMKKLENSGQTPFYQALGTSTAGMVDSDIRYLNTLSIEPMVAVTALSPVNIMVTDPLGYRIGYDPETQLVVNEIPNATYSGVGSEPQIISISNPLNGTYLLDAFGIGNGSYAITIQSFANGSIVDSISWEGIALPDQQYTQTIDLGTDGELTSIYDLWTRSFAGTHPIVDFAVYNEILYAASDNNLYVYDGNNWTTIQAPAYVLSLVPYEAELYIGGKGGLYSFNGTDFTLILTTSGYVKVLGIYNNTLYAGTVLDNPPTLFYCNGSADNPDNWYVDTAFSTMLNFSGPFGSIDSFGVYNDNMYVTSGGTVYSYNGTDWSIVTTYVDVSAFLDMKVYNGKLYLATRDQAWRKPYYLGYSGFSGRVIEFDGNNWTTVFDHDYWIYSLETYNDKLYVGTANKIYTYNGTYWKTSFNSEEGAYYAISLRTFNNTIYAGMGNGRIFTDPPPENVNHKNHVGSRVFINSNPTASPSVNSIYCYHSKEKLLRKLEGYPKSPIFHALILDI